MSEGDSDSDNTSSSGDETPKRDDRIKVYLRLRPMNKLEASRRSKHCVEIHTDEDGPPTEMTVDSPLEGEFDFSFDRVFGEKTSQSDLFQHTISPIASQLLEGYNCTVLAYGQTGSGKTHTLMGCGGGIGSAGKKKEERPGSDDKASEISSDGAEVEAVDVDLGDIEGMIPRAIRSIFELMEKNPPTIEYTIRCSYVEIHLERIQDLLNPGGVGSVPLNIIDDAPADEAAGIGENSPGVRIVGASEVYCVDETDVLALLTRGNACRSASNAKMNTDSSRSHAVFSLKVGQRDIATGEMKNSVLHMLDLAGSEMGSKQQPQKAHDKQNPNTGQTEAKMINKALSALNNLVRAQAKSQRKGGEDNKALVAASRQTKLTRLLRPSFGGNCITTVILTGSPSSYNIGETISTIRFGQFCKHIRNTPTLNTEYSSETYRKRLAESEMEQKKLKNLVAELAKECTDLKTEGSSAAIDTKNHTGPLWTTIDGILKQSMEGDDCGVSPVESRQSNSRDLAGITGSPELELERMRLELDEVRNELKGANEALHKTENALAEAQSEVAVLRTQNDGLAADSKKFVQDLIDAKNESQILSQRKIEVEHNLRTSQFRENEATTFLRQFRRFYHRLLKNKAAQGSGNTQEITKKTPGVPQLQDLIDIDKLLLESGLIEEDELQDEKSTGAAYRPSRDALLRSTHAAKNAAAAASSLATSSGAGSSSETSGEESSYVTSSSVNTSVKQMGVLDISRGNQTLDSVSEMGDGGVSQYARSLKSSVENEEKDELVSVGKADDLDNIGERKSLESYDASGNPHRGADAGAGASADPSAAVDESENSNSKSIRIGKVAYAGAVTASRQKALGTPAGRLIAAKEKELEGDLKDLTERCIELQIALNEEQANVDALTNRSGSATLSKKRLAQEAIQLRQQVDRKTHDLQAIIWKMNELHLINKTYNDKMTSREQHVSYLEENLVILQNTNRLLVKERQMAEKKLRDELDHLRSLVDGMTVPLWQFGERGEKGRTLACRIVLPVVGSKSMLNIEKDVELDSSAEDDDQDSSDFVMSSSVNQLGTVNARAGNISKENKDAKTEETFVDTATQTDAVETLEIGLQANMDPVIEKEDAVMQTDALPLIASETQTDKIPSNDASVMTEEQSIEKAITTEIATQTDPLKEPEQPSQEKSVTSEIATQTDPVDDSGNTALKLAAAGAAGTGAGLALGASNSDPRTEAKRIAREGAATSASDVVGSSAESKLSKQETSRCGEEVGINYGALRTPEQDKEHPMMSKEFEEEESSELDPVGTTSAIDRQEENKNGAPFADTETLRNVSESADNVSGGKSDTFDHKALEGSSQILEDIRTTETDTTDQLPESKLPPDFFLGGKSADFVPRRFVKKFGPTINPGVIVKENKPPNENKKKKDHADSSRSKKKKKKKSSRSEHHKKKKSSRSDSRKHSDDRSRGVKPSKH
mmetsp:Transcript_18969/g.29213  ORF Transcript_18969/g.29213 Transcript_18969/m.29213 type:complete len:1455 (+) Transcript_18969:91-4455(+)